MNGTPHGRELRVLHVLASLRGYGAERVVLDLLPKLQTPTVTAGALTIYASQVGEAERIDLPFEILDCGRRSRQDYLFLHRVVEAIRSFRPDVVHTHTHVGKYWGVIAAALARVPSVIYTEHNPCDPRRGVLDKVADLPVQHVIRRVVTFFSEQRVHLAERSRIPMQKIVTIPNGIPVSVRAASEREGRAALGVEDDRTSIVLIGRLTFQKNQQLALRSIAALQPATRRRIRLHLVGSGSDEDALRDLAKRLDVAEHVSFLGYRNDVPTLLQGADALIVTSLFEGMPLAVVEAMRAGIPVVTTPWIGAAEMLGYGRYGMITAGWEPANVSECIERAMGSAGRKMAARAKDLAAEQFGVERMAQSHETLYREICATAR